MRPALWLGLAGLLVTATAAPASGFAAAVAWQSETVLATGPALQGPWRQNDSRWDYLDDPAVAMDDHGRVALAWVDQARRAVLFQRRAADGTPAAPPVDFARRPETFSWLPRVAIAPDDPERIYVLWQEIIFSGGSHGGDILFARSRDGGRSFEPPLNLSQSLGGAGKGRISKELWHNGSLDLAAGPGGALHVAWTEYEGGLWLARSADGGASFAPPRQVAGSDAEPARGPSLALGREGTVHLAWTVGEDAAADLRFASFTAQHAPVAAPRVLARTEGFSESPKLAADGRGRLHLVWGESTGGPYGPYHLRYARSADGGRTFEPPRAISGPGAGFPALALDGEGNPYVLAERFEKPGRWPRGLVLVVSRDGGERFGEPAAVPGSAGPDGAANGNRQGLLTDKLAVNRHGAVAVVNSSFVRGRESRVWLIRGG